MLIANEIYYVISAVLVLGVLIGIGMMSKVKSARFGNLLSALCTVVAIAVVLYNNNILTAWQVWLGLAIGAVIGLIGAVKVKMIEMPQAVALLNGLGGLASALVAILSIQQANDDMFAVYVGAIALLVGWITFTGSLVAAGKLHKLLPQKPVVWKAHSLIVAVNLIALIGVIIMVPDCIWLISVLSAFFGIAFAIRVGGADMPITISLLNSLSGVAGGIAGIAVGDPLLVAIGGVVGASGLLLTQIMCRAMNRSLISILIGASAKPSKTKKVDASNDTTKEEEPVAEVKSKVTVESIMSTAKKVMIVPGYGMALAQAQSTVKALSDKLESKGVEVKFAIHPVAGRMPGHMNVLLCEVDVPYDKLYEMDAVNDEFAECDAAIIIGANDVVNPAANTAEGTPIYGMPVLNAADAKNVIICNFDDKPGYAGVPNPLYSADNALLMLGDAKDTVAKLVSAIDGAGKTEDMAPVESGVSIGAVMSTAKKVMIVPGYGMALAQAQSTVKALSDKLESKGVEVKFAIHPVAGRMPGHMNVLLCEVDVPYDKLYEMDAVNGEFSECDAAIIIGANDVVNPAANTAEGTPIYGMPVLNAADAKNVIICNFDDKPGYAGVPNPLYSADNAILMLGDAKDTVSKIIESF